MGPKIQAAIDFVQKSVAAGRPNCWAAIGDLRDAAKIVIAEEGTIIRDDDTLKDVNTKRLGQQYCDKEAAIKRYEKTVTESEDGNQRCHARRMMLNLGAMKVHIHSTAVPTETAINELTILQANPLGGMCARVCPTEVLCEQACVRNTHEDKPVEIGLLQRYATDHLMAHPGAPLFTRAPSTGRRVAVVGADGISHNEMEDAKPEHIAAGCNVLLHAMLERAGT
jgi:hypothetical protein